MQDSIEGSQPPKQQHVMTVRRVKVVGSVLGAAAAVALPFLIFGDLDWPEIAGRVGRQVRHHVGPAVGFHIGPPILAFLVLGFLAVFAVVGAIGGAVLSGVHPSLSRTRRLIVTIVALPAMLLVIGAVTPAVQPRLSPSALTTLAVLFLAAPLLSLAAVVVPLLVPREYVYRRRVIRACCLSVAALLLVADFWLIGIIAGQKEVTWKIELIPAAVLLGLALSQVPVRGPTV